MTENIITMCFPATPDPRQPGGAKHAGNDIHAVAAYLDRHHAGKYLVWNISEETCVLPAESA